LKSKSKFVVSKSNQSKPKGKLVQVVSVSLDDGKVQIKYWSFRVMKKANEALDLPMLQLIAVPTKNSMFLAI
jgi:hypothetical protein